MGCPILSDLFSILRRETSSTASLEVVCPCEAKSTEVNNIVKSAVEAETNATLHPPPEVGDNCAAPKKTSESGYISEDDKKTEEKGDEEGDESETNAQQEETPVKDSEVDVDKEEDNDMTVEKKKEEEGEKKLEEQDHNEKKVPGNNEETAAEDNDDVVSCAEEALDYQPTVEEQPDREHAVERADTPDNARADSPAIGQKGSDDSAGGSPVKSVQLRNKSLLNSVLAPVPQKFRESQVKDNVHNLWVPVV